MRERSQTTPRRRRAGPKQALPPTRSSRSSHESSERVVRVGELESPYYSIDNTEDIYGTTLLPSQRCYVDPWDLENYDYVRKKIDDVTTAGGMGIAETDYGHTAAAAAASATANGSSSTGMAGTSYGYGMSATMPRPHTQTRRISRSQCQLECCVPRSSHNYHRKEPLYTARSEIYGAPNRYDDYMATMTRQLHLDDDDYDNGDEDEDHERERDQQDLYREEQRQLYNGYGGFSSASSTEQHSSIGGNSSPLPRRAATLQRRSVPSHKITSNNNNSMLYGYGTAPNPRRKRSGPAKTTPSAPPQIDFPAPPPLSPAYDYCNPYATLPYCSIPDCTECQHHATSLIYAAPSTLYGTLAGGRAKSQSPHSQMDGDSSLYSGIYSRKFGLSKKGLLQIDYSCSWTDLDRVMGRQY